MKKPRGIIPAMLTVFNKDGSIDVGGTRAFAEWLIQKGVHGLGPAGSTGEAAAMTNEERIRVIRAVVDQTAGRVPVYAGIIHYSTDLAVQLAKDAMDAGADGLMVLLPFYYQPTVSSVLSYLRSISNAIGQPILLYNNPWFAGYELSPKEIKQLADEGVVYGVKAAHGDPMRSTYIKHICGDQVTALYGHDYAPLEAFAGGADGWLSGLPNLVPDLAVQLFEAIVEKKDLALGQQIWQRIAPFGYYFMYEREGKNPAPHWLTVFKEGLQLIGQSVGYPRKPAEPMTEDERESLRQVLAQVYPELVTA